MLGFLILHTMELTEIAMLLPSDLLSGIGYVYAS